jgi:hypothetical protein
MNPLLLAIVSALLGAIATGATKIVLDARERSRHRQSSLVAVVSEVDAICRLIRHQHYLEAVEGALALGQDGKWEGKSLVVDIRADYFTVFNGLGARLGDLKPEHVRDIVRFYAYAKAAIDSLRPDGPHADPARSGSDELIANFESVRALIGAMLILGEQICQFPGEPIASNFAAWPGDEPKSLSEARSVSQSAPASLGR